MALEVFHEHFCVSDDKTRLQTSVIHGFLSNESYWAKGISRETVERAIAHSVCFGVYDTGSNAPAEGWTQVGFARVVTDTASFAYLADVFVLPAYRGRGLSKWLMEQIIAYPELQNLRRWMLGTRDAHKLYEQFGFVAIDKPEIFMQIHNPHVYAAKP